MIWKEAADGICLEKYEGDAERVSLPETALGRPVTEIGAYSFHGHREIVACALPKSVKRLGAHAFYDCRKLSKLSLSDQVTEIGDGAFKNCRLLSEIEVAVTMGHFAGLKNILEECSQKMVVTLHFVDGSQAKLVFPRFLQDYEENTAARIINQVTYGAGVHYRTCIEENRIDFVRYDARFDLLKNLEAEEVAGETAVYRLTYPQELSESAADIYRSFLLENVLGLTQTWLEKERLDLIEALADLVEEKEREVMLRTAQEKGVLAAVSLLLAKGRKTEAPDEWAF
ncbi:MAG: leucine-rich repeat domain-containing protein [Lachnospiraceae bacterium]|nr:leucine-rich repeat domain-containing protein [Lachnospiraceae bacterium]